MALLPFLLCEGSTAPVATLNFDVLSGAGDEVSKLGQDYISLDVFDHGR